MEDVILATSDNQYLTAFQKGTLVDVHVFTLPASNHKGVPEVIHGGKRLELVMC